jgi:mannose-6-phosphate isomerase-like protein (cupin superfamily)
MTTMNSPYKEERPWGSFEILYEEKLLKVKRIVVKPGKRLSLQSHRSRAENWVLLQGNALVTLDEKEIPWSPNQSIFIPAEVKHRVANQGSNNVVFIEVQTGTYLGEDDIIRYQDDFNRL